MYTNVQSHTIHNGKSGNNPNVRQHTVDKQKLVFTNKEREFSSKKEGSTEICANLDEPRKHMSSERGQTAKVTESLIPFLGKMENGEVHRDRM